MQQRGPTRVLIVDDHPVWADGLRTALSAESGIEVVGVASNGQEALTLTSKLQPAVVLLDARLRGQSGPETARLLRSQFPSIHVLALSAHDDEETVFEMLRAGAGGYLLKDVEPEAIAAAIRELVAGGAPMAPSVARKLVREVNRLSMQATTLTNTEGLTNREMEVLRLVANGWSNRRIAQELCLSERTVENHLHNIFHKLQVHDRTQAALYALRRGWINRTDIRS